MITKPRDLATIS